MAFQKDDRIARKVWSHNNTIVAGTVLNVDKMDEKYVLVEWDLS